MYRLFHIQGKGGEECITIIIVYVLKILLITFDAGI